MSGNDQQQSSAVARLLVAAVALSSLTAGALIVDVTLNFVVPTAAAPEKVAPIAN